MSKVKALLMAIALVLIGSVLYQAELNAPEEGLADQELVFGDLSKESLSRVSFVYAGDSSAMVLDKETALWEMVRPETARLNQKNFNKLLNQLLSIRVENSLSLEEQDADQSIYGLVPPEFLVTLKVENERTVVSVGKVHPVSGRRYLQPEHDSRIYVIDDSAYTQMIEALSSARNRRPFVIDARKVNRINAVDLGSYILDLEKTSEGWVIRDGKKRYPADSRLIERELKELEEAEAPEVFDESQAFDLAVFGLGVPKLILNLESTEPNEYGETTVNSRIGEGPGLEESTAGTAARLILSGYSKSLKDPSIYKLQRPIYRDWLLGFEHFLSKSPFVGAEKFPQSSFKVSCEKADCAVKSELLKAFANFEVLSYQKFSAKKYQEYNLTKPLFALSVAEEDTQLELRLGEQLKESGSDTSSENAPHIAMVRGRGKFIALAVVSREQAKIILESVK